MKHIVLILFAVLTLSITGCGTNNSNAVPSSSETSECNTSITVQETEEMSFPSGEEMSHMKIERSTGPGRELLSVPVYYQQDFSHVPYKSKSIAEYGALITCLSMLDSYFNAEFHTPDIYINDYEVDNNKTSDELIQDFANKNYCNVIEEDFNAETVSGYLLEKRIVLLRITHPSIFGNDSSYMLLTGVTDDARICVRDPNQLSINNYAEFTPNNEPTYDATVLCEQASASSKIYTFVTQPH